ncbi:Protein MAIN-LIKE 2, partial [Linum perenne]
MRQRSTSLRWSPLYQQFLEGCRLSGVLPVLGHTPCKKLVTALIERWRPETNTFHLVPGEATITLEDVEVLTGLPTTGRPLIVSPDEQPVPEICEQWLGIQPPPNAVQGRTIKVAWVKRLFDRLPDGASGEVITYHARAYTWVLVAGVLLADRNGDHIPVHLLQLIGDPRVASTYSWGSAVLAWLYKVMGRAAFFFCWSSVTDWVAKYQEFVLHWEQRGSHIATGELVSDDWRHHFHDEYDEWYRRRTRLAISRGGAQYQMM